MMTKLQEAHQLPPKALIDFSLLRNESLSFLKKIIICL